MAPGSVWCRSRPQTVRVAAHVAMTPMSGTLVTLVSSPDAPSVVGYKRRQPEADHQTACALCTSKINMGRLSVVDASAPGFALAMDVSCHSFLRIARLAEPLMRTGGTLLTVTFYGSARVVDTYNLMGRSK